jgi:predicted O-methyltransferase YrrM
MPDDLTTWITKLFSDRALTRMGHAQRVEDLNLGLGWIYYGLTRAARPQRVVVIGSHRGFAPLVFARALADNAEGGRVTFIDPSFVDDFWTDPASVQAHFATYGLDNIDHHRMTTQEFIASPAWKELNEVGILFVDGYHSEEQARFDHEAFISQLGSNGYTLFHDSVRERLSKLYGPNKHYMHDVYHYMDALRRDPNWEVLALPFGDGLCMVRPVEPRHPTGLG